MLLTVRLLLKGKAPIKTNVTPDEAFRQLLNKAVRKIKASGIDGISTQAQRALQAKDDAVAFIAKTIKRIIIKR